MEPVSTKAVGRARVALCGDFFVFGVGIGIWAVNIPLVATRLDLNTAMVGTVLLTVATSAIVAMPLGGFAAGKWGSRAPAIVGGLVYSLAIAALVLAPNLVFLFLAAAVLGLSMGFFEVAMNAQGTEIEAATGRPGLSLLHGFFSLGGLAGAGVSALVIRNEFGGGPGEVAIALVLAVIVVVAGSQLLPVGSTAEGPKFALPTRAVLALGLLAALGFALEGAFIDWGALFLTDERGASSVGAAVGVGVFMAALAVFRLVGGKIIETFGARRTFVVSGLLVTAGTAVAVSVPWLPLIVIGIAATGAGSANIVPILFSASARIPGVSPALGIASATTLAYGGFLIAPPLLGFIGHELSLAFALGLAGAAGLVLAAAGTRVRL
jgi:MFS family permease